METKIFFYNFPTELVYKVRKNKDWELVRLPNNERDQSFVEFDVKCKGEKVMSIGRDVGFGFSSQPGRKNIKAKFIPLLQELLGDQMKVEL